MCGPSMSVYVRCRRKCVSLLWVECDRQRIIGDTKKQWQSYLEGIGSSEEEILTHFLR